LKTTSIIKKDSQHLANCLFCSYEYKISKSSENIPQMQPIDPKMKITANMILNVLVSFRSCEEPTSNVFNKYAAISAPNKEKTISDTQN
jgi:hypothetical protein